MTEFVNVSGKLSWVRTHTPEEFNGKKSWKATVHPDKESMEVVMGLMSKGCKNKIKRDDNNNYYVSYSRLVEKRNKAGKVTQTWDPPKVTDMEGKEITEFVGNDSEGTLRLEVYQHAAPQGGKSYAARLDSIKISKFVPYVGANANGQWTGS